MISNLEIATLVP